MSATEQPVFLEVNACQLKLSFFEAFLSVVQDNALLDQAVIAEEAIRATKLTDVIATNGSKYTSSLPLSILETIGVFCKDQPDVFDETHSIVQALGIEWNKPERFRGQCQRLKLNNINELSISACLRIRAAIQHASNKIIASKEVSWLNAYINELNVDDSHQFEEWNKANQLNMMLMQSESLLMELSLDFDLNGYATINLINSIKKRIEELNNETELSSLCCQIDTQNIEPPEERVFAESLNYRLNFLCAFLQLYAAELATSSLIDEDLPTRRAKLLIELIQQTILVMAQKDKWQTSYQLEQVGIDAETVSFNVPYSIFQQTELIRVCRMNPEDASPSLVLEKIIVKSAEFQISWIHWIRNALNLTPPNVCRWHELLSMQNAEELVNNDFCFKAFIKDLNDFSNSLDEVPESSWVLIEEEINKPQSQLTDFHSSNTTRATVIGRDIDPPNTSFRC